MRANFNNCINSTSCDSMSVQLVDITKDAEKKIVECARVCYDSAASPKRTDKDLIKLLVTSKHTSVLEHGIATFDVQGISRACGLQLVRHRIGMSYSQRSQRFVDETKFAFVVPTSIAMSNSCFVRYNRLMEEIQSVYKELISQDIPRQDARFILPNACTTTIAVTANFRALFNFFDQRLSKKAQWEIRNLATCMLKLVYAQCPLIFDKYKDFL